MLTRDELTAAASGLRPRDFAGFAERVARLDPVLGATVRLHAEAADGNSPDVAEWVRHTADDAAAIDAAGILGPVAAATWWRERYGV